MYACDETDTYMPMTIYLSHRLVERLTFVRKNSILQYLFPDGKGRVSVEGGNGEPNRIDTIILSTQHMDTINPNQLRKDIIENVIMPIIPENLLNAETKIHINPTGHFIIGKPKAR